MVGGEKLKKERKKQMKETQGTKLCKYCKTEIPAGAKVCPNCRKKQGGAGKWIAIAIIAVVIIAAIAGGGKDNEPKKVGDSGGQASSGQENKNEESKETVFRMGETAELNGVQVTLTNYKESSGSEWNKPSDGNVFVLAEFEISNGTEDEMVVSSMLSFEAYADDYKLDYSISALMENDGTQLDGNIAAGKKMKGWMGWEVPSDYANVEIHFTDNVWSNNKFVFLIEK